ncbi:MAG: tetratricopeptide repeat protein [Sphingobacteriaceae bacterium]|nr:tetratricopeptide repeat protein [Sphingobacteriaceae bacterium]
MGNAYYLKKDNLNALKYLQKAVTISPNNPKANYLLGNISMEIKKYDIAVLVYKQAVLYNPYYAEAYLGLSNAYQFLGDMTKSQQYRRRANELNPNIGK